LRGGEKSSWGRKGNKGEGTWTEKSRGLEGGVSIVFLRILAAYLLRSKVCPPSEGLRLGKRGSHEKTKLTEKKMTPTGKEEIFTP